MKIYKIIIPDEGANVSQPAFCTLFTYGGYDGEQRAVEKTEEKDLATVIAELQTLLDRG